MNNPRSIKLQHPRSKLLTSSTSATGLFPSLTHEPWVLLPAAPEDPHLL